MELIDYLRLALEEDIGQCDYTTVSCVKDDIQGEANLLVKEAGIIAGVDIAEKIFSLYDSTLVFEKFIYDGKQVKSGDIVFKIRGKVRSILTCERTVLNFMQRMSGIATQTNKYVKLLEGYKTKLLDTRKTTPNFRIFEKMAVKIGGGENHRIGLYDMILIKDNHIDYAGSIEIAIHNVKKYLKENNLNLKIEIETRNLKEVEEVLKIGDIDRIMLDNFTISDLKEAIKMIDGKYETEASGGINEKNIREYAETGVDYISVGALTHQIKSLDLSLKAR